MTEIPEPEESTGFSEAEAIRIAHAESEGRPQDMVESFETAKGSIYRYDDYGRTTRFKTATGEQIETQGITVFVDPNDQQVRQIRDAYLLEGASDRTVYIVEKRPDSSAKIVRDISEVEDRRRLGLVVTRGGKPILLLPASIFPILGHHVFDMRHYEKGDEEMTERHLGHTVSKINYRY